MLEVIIIKICPYLESCFEILGRRWNGLIIHYLSNCPEFTAHFSQMKRDLNDITPRSLSLKLTELAEHGLSLKKSNRRNTCHDFVSSVRERTTTSTRLAANSDMGTTKY